jgi:predicted esterase
MPSSTAAELPRPCRFPCWVLIWAVVFCNINYTTKNLLGQSREERQEQARLRGSITPERAWWDLRHYGLAISVDVEQKTLQGSNKIRFLVLQPGQKMQLDLQQPLQIDRVTWTDQELAYERLGSVYYLHFPEALAVGQTHEIKVFYSGQPVESRNPPWSGGITWTRDSEGNPFIASSCQGIGASIWWPCKDHGYDEPDEGVSIAITVPAALTAVANGRLLKTEDHPEQGTRTFHWGVTLPINNYCVNMNIGNYVHFADTYEGEFGKLDMEFWVLDHEREKALVHFKEAFRTIEAFEYWFGKYPFYEDSYKLVSVPYLGMEHQSSVTYGNGFRFGYRGTDLSGTGVGLKFDFIIVHESGHEWWGNNISMKDVADMWIHESFTNYSENLFVEYHFSRKEAEDYVIGCRRLIRNDRPIIGDYDVNKRGSDDMYYKGGNVLHTLRHLINDDQRWRQILRGLNTEFWHQTVTTAQVEDYISQQSGIDLQPFFDQYLRSVKIPRLVYQIDGTRLTYFFEEVVEGLEMPIRVTINQQTVTLNVHQQPQTYQHPQPIESFEVDRNFYIETRIAEPDQAPTLHSSLQPGRQIAHAWTCSDQASVPFLIYVPANYQPAENSYPLMLFLHGRGESGEDLAKVKKWGPPQMVERGESLPFIIVSPQCPADDWWASEAQTARLTELLDWLTESLPVDRERIYLTGLSMGGYGTWALASRQPNRFAAIVPVCGGGSTDTAAQLTQLPIWAFHGDQDQVVPLKQSQEMVDAIRQAGNTQIRFTILEHVGHNSWSSAYALPELYSWMLQQQRQK